MSFYGAIRVLVVGWDRPSPTPPPGIADALPEIEPGRFAAWAREDLGSPPLPLAPGDACRTVDGRAGRIVEVLDEDRMILVCTAA
jgi:hypothetical protein